MAMTTPTINPRDYHIAIDGYGSVYRLFKDSEPLTEGFTVITPDIDPGMWVMIKPSKIEPALPFNDLGRMFFEPDGMLKAKWTAYMRIGIDKQSGAFVFTP